MSPGRPIVEVLNSCPPYEAVTRMKIGGLIKLKSDEFDFRRFGNGDQLTDIILINKLFSLKYITTTKEGYDVRQQRPNAVVMLFISDLLAAEVDQYKSIPDFIDVILVPTQEMKHYLELFTSCRVEILIDPIDFCLCDSITIPADYTEPPGPMKLVWFGYPESYGRSMSGYENTIMQLVDEGVIEFHLITRHKRYGKSAFGTIHKYDPATFANFLTEFDVCIVSHMPFDFLISTCWKSESKAVLAINRGLPVIASKTPAYERLLTRCNLQKYLFRSHEELIDALHNLKSVEERRRYLKLSQDIILREYSCQKMSDDWIDIYENIKRTKM